MLYSGLRLGHRVEIAALARVRQPDGQPPLNLGQLADVQQSTHREAEGVGLLPRDAGAALAKDGRRLVAETGALLPLAGEKRGQARAKRAESQRVRVANPSRDALGRVKDFRRRSRAGPPAVDTDAASTASARAIR